MEREKETENIGREWVTKSERRRERGGRTIRASLLSPLPRPPPPPITSKLTSVDSGFDDLYVFVDAPVVHLLLLLVNLNVHAHNSTKRNNTSATRSRYPYVPVTFTWNCVCARAKYSISHLRMGKAKGSSHEGAAKCASCVSRGLFRGCCTWQWDDEAHQRIRTRREEEIDVLSESHGTIWSGCLVIRVHAILSRPAFSAVLCGGEPRGRPGSVQIWMWYTLPVLSRTPFRPPSHLSLCT